ncbi:hypothetical protein QQF64_034143 [Cirrhinus molitorella]|uniref:Uncharacterized protein n=1 Tax=Cirrhinus molitorella TaxID=172907 RepID=A0ABR3MW59_9TELE
MPGELDENEKSGKIADEAEENSNRKTNETQSQKTEDADKNENHQTPKEKKEKEGEKKETDSPNKETVSPQPAVAERSTMDTGNVEDSPNKGSSDATLTAPKESIADKKCEQDSGSENATHEEKKEKEKENKGTDSPNTGELDENEKSGKIADAAEENYETQCQKTEDADKNENDQTPKEKKEKERKKKETDSPNKETVSPQPAVTEGSTMDTGNVEDSLNKGSSDAILTAPKESIADKKCDQDSGSKNVTHEEKKEKEKENKGTDSLNTGELDENEKSGKIANEAEENSNGKTDETQSQKTEDADKNENHQTPKEKKEKEGEKKETDSPNKETVSPQPAVTEISTMDTGNVEELQHTNENNSQNENGKQLPEQQKSSPCTAINKDDQVEKRKTPRVTIEYQI